ncbi:MAG: hypothetical protein KME30_32780 [Iphinoe sp. HA4291-MV1]|jgi:hypothetical protein|nr:hypothetical protein [Iphinoe sp. HA4291-MV1]
MPNKIRAPKNGFGEVKRPLWWIEVVDSEGNSTYYPEYRVYEKVLTKARNFVRDIQPPIDVCLIIRGDADPRTGKLKPDDIVTSLNPHSHKRVL